MALKKTFKFSGIKTLQSDEVLVNLGDGEAEVDFYIKIERIAGTKEKIDMRVSFNSAVATMQKDFSFDYDINGENPIAQAYAYLKTLPEFEGAVNC